jgi:hypothetical protein
MTRLQGHSKARAGVQVRDRILGLVRARNPLREETKMALSALSLALSLALTPKALLLAVLAVLAALALEIVSEPALTHSVLILVIQTVMTQDLVQTLPAHGKPDSFPKT